MTSLQSYTTSRYCNVSFCLVLLWRIYKHVYPKSVCMPGVPPQPFGLTLSCLWLNPCIPCLHRKLPCPGTTHPLSRTAVKTYALARHCWITKLDLSISIETFWSVCGLSSLVLSVVCFSFVPVLSGLLYLPFSHHREGSIDFNTVNIHRTVGRDVFLDIFTPNRDQSVTFVRI